jgi:hypothetical protein
MYNLYEATGKPRASRFRVLHLEDSGLPECDARQNEFIVGLLGLSR